MTDLPAVLFGLAGGIGLGLAVFGGLRLTLHLIPTVRRPGLLMGLSIVARLGGLVAALAGLAAIGGWPAVVTALGGMLVVRTAMLRSEGAT